MTLPQFKKATRSKARIKICITGPSGSGKTYSSLKIAQGIGGKIAVIDSESGSASLYSDQPGMPEFDTLELSPPYTTEKYIAAIKLAVDAQYDVLIVDSGTHQWAGEGGILARKEQLDQRPNSNSYTNWGKLTPEQEQFKAAILHAPINLIMTLRSKQEYALVKDERTGKNKVEKLGMAPVQRDGLEYEFSTVFDADMTHNVSVSKDRTGIFDGQYFKITENTGKQIVKWMNSSRSGSGEAKVGGGLAENLPPPTPSTTTENKPMTITSSIKMPKITPLSPDEFITLGKRAGSKIDEMSVDHLEDWADQALTHFKKSDIDPETSMTDMARTYRAVRKRCLDLQPSMFESVGSVLSGDLK